MAWCDKCFRSWGRCDYTDATCRRAAGIVEFQPCATYYPDANHTELTLKDAPTVWVEGVAFDLGYDFDGNLIAMRVPGDRTKR